MIDADEINASLEASRQAMLRDHARKGTRASGMKGMFVGHEDEFDLIPLGNGQSLMRIRDKHKGLMTIPDGEYGS